MTPDKIRLAHMKLQRARLQECLRHQIRDDRIQQKLLNLQRKCAHDWVQHVCIICGAILVK